MLDLSSYDGARRRSRRISWALAHSSVEGVDAVIVLETGFHEMGLTRSHLDLRRTLLAIVVIRRLPEWLSKTEVRWDELKSTTY